MNFQTSPDLGSTERQLPFECVALVLQGGGALGAYQAGVYEALAEARIDPDWIAGISIGGINSAIIAGNPVNMRVERLREFWTLITADAPLRWCDWPEPRGDNGRKLLNQVSANVQQWLRRQRTWRQLTNEMSMAGHDQVTSGR